LMPFSFSTAAVTCAIVWRTPDSSACADLVTPCGSEPELLPYAEDEVRSPLLELLLCPAAPLVLLESRLLPLLLPLVSADFCWSSAPNTAES